MTTKEDRIRSYRNFVKVREDKKIFKDIEIARKVGMSPSSFTDWKNGVSQPNALHIVAIAKVLKVSPSKLMGWT